MAEIVAAKLVASLRLGLAQLNKDSRDATGVLRGLDKEVKGLKRNFSDLFKFAGLAAGIAGAGYAVKKFSDSVVRLAEEGDKLGDLRDNFKKLGGSEAELARAKKATLGMVDSLELTEIAVDGLVRKIPGFNENFGKIAELGSRVAQALGKETAAGISQVEKALAQAKPRQLEAVNIHINAGKAYQEYAASIGVAAKYLDEAQKKEARQLAAIKQLDPAIASLAEVTDGVANAHAAYTRALDDAGREMGLAINANTDLTKAWRTLEKAIDDVNWGAVGEDIAIIEGLFLSMASTALPKLVQWLNEVARGFDYLFGDSLQAKADHLASKIEDLQTKRDDLANGSGPFGLIGRMSGKQEQGLANLDAMIEKSKLQLSEYKKQMEAASKAGVPTVAGPTSVNVNINHRDKSIKALEAEAKAAKKAAEEVEKLNQKLAQDISKQKANSLKDQLEKALEQGNFEGARSFFEEYRLAISAVADEQVKQFEGANENTIREYKEGFITEALTPISDEIIKKQKDAYDEGIQFWRSTFENAITGVKFSLEDALKQVAVGFAAEVAQGLLGGLTGALGKITSPQDLGGALAQKLFGLGVESGGASLLGGSTAAGGLGIGSIIGSAGGGAGVMLADGSIVAAGSAEAAAGIGSAAMPGSGVAGFAAANPYVAAAIAIAAIGSQTNWFGLANKGPKNPDTKARQKVESFIEDKTGENFILGSSSRFNKPGWADDLNGLDSATRSGFMGLGEGLRQTLGIAEDIGPQIAAILSDNLNGNLEEASSLFKELGLDAEEVKTKITEAGLAAGKSWLEIEGQLLGIDELTKEHKKDFESIDAAFQAVIDSAGTGMPAVNAVVGVASEAIQAGAKGFDDLKKKLQEKFPTSQVEIYFQSLKDLGITSFAQLEEAALRTLGAIVAHMEALGFQFREMSKQISDAATSVGQISTPGSETMKFASGGVVHGPMMFRSGQLGLLGEAGPEAIMPLSRVNGKLGVAAAGGGSQIVVNVDARGAAPGVDQQIRRAFADMQDRAVQRAVDQVVDMSRKGYF